MLCAFPNRLPGRSHQLLVMPEPKFTQTQTFLSLTRRVSINIHANTPRVWSLLTDAQGFPRWNSTVTKIEGQIREGERIRLHVPGTKRTFTPTISGFVPNRRMVWTGGFAPLFKGVRVFELTQHDDGSTDFAMEERFAGLMMPLVRRSFPDFGPVFASYAGDLKKAAEQG
jgi:hypothetical protein